MRKLRLYLILLFVLILWSCKKPDIRGIHLPEKITALKFIRFDRDFNKLRTGNQDSIKTQLTLKYPVFYELYNTRVINICNSGDTAYSTLVLRFLNDAIYREVFDTVQVHFREMSIYEKELSEGFARFKEVFPDKLIPKILSHISGFNEPIVAGDSLISVSLDDYLGGEHEFYNRLGLYVWQRKQCKQSQIVPDLLKGWLISEFEIPGEKNRLIDRMVYEGSIVYLMSLLLPERPLDDILGLEHEQIKWSEKNEKAIWMAMVEWKHLFSSDMVTIKKHMEDGPFNSHFGKESSPKSGLFIGYRIVKNFMEKNPDVSVSALLLNQNAEEILQKSGYRP